MIFVTLGSQKFQFNRLLKELDRLVENEKIEEEIFAQIGYSDHKPQNYKYKDFLERDEFKKHMEESDIVITHGGTGAIITAVKQEKKVIAIPRLAKYGEHVDDHQVEIIHEFQELNFIESVYEINDILTKLDSIKEKKFNIYKSNTQEIINDIKKYINESGN